MAARNPDLNVIIGEIVTALKAMHTDNEYNYTQNASYVFDWMESDIDIASDITHINVMDISSSQDIEGGYSNNVLEIHIVISKNGDNAREIIRKTMQDVLKCMYEDFLPDSVARDIDYRGTEPVYDSEKRLMGDAEMIFDVLYKTQRGQI